MPIDPTRLRSTTALQPASGSDFGTSVENFITSALSAAGPELIGLDPLKGVDKFRHENPFAGGASEFLGEAGSFLVPLARPVQAVSKALPVARGLFRASEAAAKAGRPIRSTVLKDIGIFAPFEAGRVALAATLGDNPEDVAADAALDLALIGGGAGLIKGFQQAIPFKRRLQSSGRLAQKEFPREINLNANPHEQLRKIRELKGVQGLTPEKITTLDDFERDLILHIRSQRPTLGGKLFRSLEGPKGQPRSRKLEGLLRGSRFNVKILGRHGSAGVDDPDVRADLTNRILSVFSNPNLRRSPEELERLGPGFEGRLEEFSQFMRVLQPGSDKKAAALVRELRDTLGESKGPGLFIAKERNEGLFVVAKKFGGTADRASAADEWVVFKTDRPELFAPRSYAEFSRKVNKLAFGPIESAVRSQETASVAGYSKFRDVLEALTHREFLGESVRNPKAIGPVIGRLLAKSGSEDLRLVAGELQQVGLNSGRFVKAFLAPAITQFGSNPRAQGLFGTARYAFQEAEQRASRIVFGSPTFAAGRSAIGTLLGKVERSDGLDDLIKSFDDKDLLDATTIYVDRLPLDIIQKGVQEGRFSPRIGKLFSELQDLDRNFQRRYNILNGNADGGKLKPMEAHYMLSRSWRGDFRIAVRKVETDGSRGDVVWVASGRTKKQAVQQANTIQARLAEQGMNVRWGDRDLIEVSLIGTDSFKQELNMAAQINMEALEFKRAAAMVSEAIKKTNSVAFGKESKGIGGFIGQEEPLTLREFRDLVQRNVFSRERLLVDNMIRRDPLFRSELGKLAQEDPELLKQLKERLDDLSGRQGALVKLIEGYADKPLEPFLGRNGASKILRQTNRMLFNFTLGFGNLGFPLLNAVTTIQTALPEIAYTLRSPTAALMRDYTMVPLVGSNGKLSGAAGTLEPLKILKRSFKELRGKDPLFVQDIARGMQEGVLDPRFAEEFVGEKSNLGVLMKSSFGKDREGFWNGVEELSSYLPARTEVLARGHSFTLGRIVGRDYFGLQDEALYQFAKQFTDRTMFLYSTADRPRIMSGAIGGTLGLFKNWTAHYIANFMKYTNEGIQRGNWHPLLWQMAGTWTLAGAGGLPAYSMMDGAQKMFSDQPLIERTYDWFGYKDEADDFLGEEFAGGLMDGMFYGLPGFMGISLQGSAAAPGSDVARDASMMFSFALMDRATALGKAMGGAIDSWTSTGTSPMADRRTRDQFFRALAPRTLYKAMQYTEDRGLRSLNSGNRLISDVSMGEGALFALGLTPTDIQRRFEASNILWTRQEELRSKVSALGGAWAEAERSGDSRMLTVVAREAASDGILDSVIRSAKARRAKQESDVLERQLNDAQARATRDALAFRR